MSAKKNDKVNISLNCPHCGKPISTTSRQFGMDCENHCGEKAFQKTYETMPSEQKQLADWLADPTKPVPPLFKAIAKLYPHAKGIDKS